MSRRGPGIGACAWPTRMQPSDEFAPGETAATAISLPVPIVGTDADGEVYFVTDTVIPPGRGAIHQLTFAEAAG